MKKVCVCLMITVMLLCGGVTIASAAGIGVTIDQVPVQFDDSTGYPFVDGNGRTLVPLRAVMEAYGLDVAYDPATQTIIIHDPTDKYKDKTVVNLKVGQNYYLVTYEPDSWRAPGVTDQYGMPLDSPATVINGRTYVPIRALLEEFQAGVAWDPYRSLVVVRSNGTEAVIHAPYNDPSTSSTTAGRERFGGPISQVGLVVDYIETDFEEYWFYAGKDFHNVNVTHAVIVNRSGKKIDFVRMKLCVFDKATNQLFYSDDVGPSQGVWEPRMGIWISRVIPGYDPAKHDIEILLAN